MKKTISINLQGIIFHVEEDGYALLSSYLGSVKAYFSRFEGHEEIMADIESRMAELFLTRLGPGKQIISHEDVQHLIARMGSVQDFAAQAEEEEAATGNTYTHTQTEAGRGFDTAPKKLYLDESRKILGGVAAGLAHYLQIDPLWVRLFFVMMVLTSPFTAGSTAGFALVMYFVLWVVLPPSITLPDSKTKKLYRDPDNKKLSGVSSGIGHYFGIDPIWVRLFFLVLLFAFGTGVFAYIVLWIIMPEAKTASEKAEMRGNPVTLSSIEEAIRNNRSFRDEQGRENAVARVLLLPVQLLSQLIEAVGPVLKAVVFFLLTLIRVLGGILMVLTGLSLLAAAVVLLLAGIGVLEEGIYAAGSTDLPLHLFRPDLPWYGIISGFLVIFIPGLLLLLLGLSLMAKRNLIRQPIGWTLLGLFIVALTVTGVAAGVYMTNFRQSGSFTEETRLPLPQSQALHIQMKKTSGTFRNLDLDIEPGKQPGLLLLQTEYRAKGRTEEEAIAAARLLKLPFTQTDSVLVFQSNQSFKEGARFRSQRMSIKLLIPEGTPFTIDERTANRADISNTGSLDTDRLVGKMLLFENGKLRCLTCTAEDSALALAPASPLPDVSDEDIPADGYSRTYPASGFGEVVATGGLTVIIRKADRYKVRAYGSRDAQDRLEIEEEGHQLKIENKNKFWNADRDEKLTVVVDMPELQGIVFAGAVKGKVSGFSPSHLDVKLIGASRATLTDLNCGKLQVDIVGASSLSASGETDELVADIVGASELNAHDLKARQVRVEATGASRARVYASERLEAEATGASSVRYSGNPRQVEKDEGAAGTIEKE